ncbi:MAG: hypothetical protein AB8I08_00745 [Sandaracinaceae bacterium]
MHLVPSETTAALIVGRVLGPPTLADVQSLCELAARFDGLELGTFAVDVELFEQGDLHLLARYD